MAASQKLKRKNVEHDLILARKETEGKNALDKRFSKNGETAYDRVHSVLHTWRPFAHHAVRITCHV